MMHEKEVINLETNNEFNCDMTAEECLNSSLTRPWDCGFYPCEKIQNQFEDEHEYYIVAENYGIPHEERMEWFKNSMWIIMDILDRMDEEERTAFLYRARPDVVIQFFGKHIE